MRPEPDLPRRPSRRERKARGSGSGGGRFRVAGRGRAIFGGGLVVLFVLLISLRGIAAFYTDYLWFDSLSLGSVWGTVLGTKATLTLIGTVIFLLLCWGNLFVADRLAPMFRVPSGDDDLIERYHEIVGHRAWLVRAGISAFLALVMGITLGSSWNEWILFNNRVDFGVKDATFNTDVGFYVFQLPFLQSAVGWMFSAGVVVLILTLLAHVMNGGIRFHTQLDRVTPQVKVHVSLLLAFLALVRCGGYWLDRYSLTFSTRGTVDGATYTDVNVELQSIYLLMAIALFATGLFVANAWRRGWVLPGMAVGLWLLVVILAGGVVPAFVQRFRVEPTESSKEAPYITNNIDATRQAYGLSGVDSTSYDWTQELDAGDLEDNLGTLANVRLWDPKLMQDSYDSSQQIKPFYAINDVDVDRYVIDGTPTQVMVAARDLDTDGVQQSSWEATHLTYTHGYGVVAAKADEKSTSGDPDLVAQDIPVKTSEGMPGLEQSGIYFGENKSGYVIVNTERKEIDYQDEENRTAYSNYQGDDGVTIGSGVNGLVRKAAFALRFGDVNPLISGSITEDSKVLLERDVSARLKAVAPFLAYDHDPYVVVLDGKAKYVVDAYTTSRNFPNAQRADTGGLDPASGLYGRSFNYARNSVKAVVDAYDGTVDLYVVDDEDPIVRAYTKAFPDLFTPVSEASEDLVAHFRYPEDLFTVQTQMWAKYHVTDPDDFYNGNDEWDVPRESGAGVATSGKDAAAVGADGQPITQGTRYQSQYVLMQLPGEADPSFVLLRPYVTSTSDSSNDKGQNQLRAFIVASSDPADYGTLRTYLLPSTNLPDGPNLAAEDIQANEDVGDQIRSQCTTKTTCTFAAPSILPIGNSLLYVQSFFVAGTNESEPKLKQVIVSYQRPGNPRVAIASSLRGALVKIFGDDVPTEIESGQVVDTPEDPTGPDEPADPGTPTEPEDPELTLSERESALIDEIVTAFDAADAAAREGDQVTYAQEVAKAQKAAQELKDLREGTGDADPGEGSGSTTTTAPGTTTTTRPKDTSTTTTTPATTTTSSAGA